MELLAFGRGALEGEVRQGSEGGEQIVDAIVDVGLVQGEEEAEHLQTGVDARPEEEHDQAGPQVVTILAPGADGALAGLAGPPGDGRRLAALLVGRGKRDEEGLELLGRMPRQTAEGAGPPAEALVSDHTPCFAPPGGDPSTTPQLYSSA